MGFLEGLMQTGKYYNLQDQAGELSDIINYLELPLDLPDENTLEERRPQVIRVGLKVTDPNAIPLDVQGVESITLTDYPSNPAIKPKLALLYKSPVGSNVTWGFSPLYKLGRGIPDPEKAILNLLGDNTTSWADDINTRFYKMHKRILADYEISGYFCEGSTDRLMADLVKHSPELARLWQDRKRSYLLIFGIMRKGRFVYPGEIPVFIEYFRTKLAKQQEGTKSEELPDCVLCHKKDAAGRTMDQVFKFSTFDKPGFLPGGSKGNQFTVYPLCEACFSLIQRGYTEVNNRFVTRIGISRLDLLIIPEMLGATQNISRLQQFFEEYVQAGVQKELGFFDDIIKRDASFVFHFLFTEREQAQVRLFRMVEDVPPSHFRKLFDCWNQTRDRFYSGREQTTSLDSAFKQIVMMVQTLAGKTDGEQKVMKTQAINLMADLFSNAYIDVAYLKRLAASRLPGLVSDPNWLNAKPYSGSYQLERLWMLFEFLYLYNRDPNHTEVNA